MSSGEDVPEVPRNGQDQAEAGAKTQTDSIKKMTAEKLWDSFLLRVSTVCDSGWVGYDYVLLRNEITFRLREYDRLMRIHDKPLTPNIHDPKFRENDDVR